MREQKQKIKRQMIREKLVRVNIFVILLTMLPLVTITLLYEYRHNREHLDNELQVKTSIIADNIAPAVVFGDQRAASETLATLRFSPDIVQARLFLPDKTLFSYYHRTREKPESGGLDSVDKAVTWNRLIFVKQVYLESEPVATLVFEASLEPFYRQILLYVVATFLASLFAFFLALYVSRRLEAKLTRPLRNLMASVNQVMEHQDLSVRPEVESNDEIGDLAYAYGELLAALHEREERMHEMAYYDAVTYLPNRNSFKEKIRSTIEFSDRFGVSSALFFIDLDDFKQVNDTYGHHVGDDLLKQVGDKIRAVLRNNDFVFRLGGDEFAVILLSVDNAESTHMLAEKIISELSKPMTVMGHELFVGASIGISLYPNHAKNSSDWIRHADTAMYVAKNNSKNTFHVYLEESA